MPPLLRRLLPLGLLALLTLHPHAGLAAPEAPILADSAPSELLVLDEETALRLARQENGELLALEAELESARHRRRQAGRLPNPEIEAEVIPDEELVLGLGLDLTHALLAPARSRVARAEEAALAARLEGERARLVYEIRVALLSAQAAETRLEVARQSLETRAAARDAAVALREAGAVPVLSTLTHEAAWEQARLELTALELERDSSREQLNGLLGLHGEEARAWVLAPLPALPETPGLGLEGVATSTEVAALGHDVEAARRRARLLRAEGWLPEIEPSLLLVGEHSAPVARLDEPTSYAPGFGLRASLPLFDHKGAAARAARAEAEALHLRQQARHSAFLSSTRQVRSAAQSAHARALHQQQVVLPLMRQLSRETLLQYNAMQLGVFELLSALRATLDAELAQVELTHAWWVAAAALEATLQGASVGLPSPSPAAGPGPDSANGGH